MRLLTDASKRPFSSCLFPLCQNQTLCATIHIEMRSAYMVLHVHFYTNPTHFHMKGFALGLVLKLRHKATQKWLVTGMFSSLTN